jgi:hypothetical protein
MVRAPEACEDDCGVYGGGLAPGSLVEQMSKAEVEVVKAEIVTAPLTVTEPVWVLSGVAEVEREAGGSVVDRAECDGARAALAGGCSPGA